MQTWQTGVDEKDQFGYWVNEESEDGKSLGQKFVPVKREWYTDNPFHQTPLHSPADGNKWIPGSTCFRRQVSGAVFGGMGCRCTIPVLLGQTFVQATCHLRFPR